MFSPAHIPSHCMQNCRCSTSLPRQISCSERRGGYGNKRTRSMERIKLDEQATDQSRCSGMGRVHIDTVSVNQSTVLRAVIHWTTRQTTHPPSIYLCRELESERHNHIASTIETSSSPRKVSKFEGIQGTTEYQQNIISAEHPTNLLPRLRFPYLQQRRKKEAPRSIRPESLG